MQKHLIRLKALDRTAVFIFTSVTDPQFLSRLHAENVGDMIYITSCDMDLMGFFIYLMRLYKKPLHEISPFLLLRRPTHPAL